MLGLLGIARNIGRSWGWSRPTRFSWFMIFLRFCDASWEELISAANIDLNCRRNFKNALEQFHVFEFAVTCTRIDEALNSGLQNVTQHEVVRLTLLVLCPFGVISLISKLGPSVSSLVTLETSFSFCILMNFFWWPNGLCGELSYLNGYSSVGFDGIFKINPFVEFFYLDRVDLRL